VKRGDEAIEVELEVESEVEVVVGAGWEEGVGWEEEEVEVEQEEELEEAKVGQWPVFAELLLTVLHIGVSLDHVHGNPAFLCPKTLSQRKNLFFCF
jgi:hypothetical protein